MERIIKGIQNIGKNITCEVVRNCEIVSPAITCPDPKLVELNAVLPKLGIMPIQMFGGVYPVALGVTSAIEHVIEQWRFFCQRHPGEHKGIFTTHDECLYPPPDTITPGEALKKATEVFEELIMDPIGGTIRKIDCIHLQFDKTGEIVPKNVVRKSF